MKMHNFDETMKLDQTLMQLAIYDITKGMIIIPHSADEAGSLQKAMAARFNYFKRLIQKGESDLDFIKENVLQKNGPFIQKKIDLDDLDFLGEFLGVSEKEQKEQEEQEKEDENDKKTKYFIKRLLSSIYPEIKELEKDIFVDKNGVKIDVEPIEMALGDLFPLLDDIFKKNEKGKFNKSDESEKSDESKKQAKKKRKKKD